MSWWHYLLLVNFYLVLFFGFYVLLLRRETFFQLNRIYLVAASLLSFFIPVMQADWVKNLFITQKIQSTIYSGSMMGYTITFVPEADVLTVGEVLNALYISVTLFLILRLFWQLLVLKKAIEKPEPSAAYSFFKKISLGKDLANRDVISAHEQVHAKQWHSVDVMIIETVMIINWFNPVVYLYRFAIKYIHEFIADRHVIKAGTDKAEYALLLLSQTFQVETHNLATPFYNHSLLKQRIMMLQKNKSQRIALAKYGLSAPLFALMLIFSSATVSNSKAVKTINTKAEKVFEQPASETIDAIADHAEILVSDVNESARTVVNTTSSALNIDTLPIFAAVENQPQFQGGMDKFYKYISLNVRYPKADKDRNIQGKVYVSFVVERDGSLTKIKALRGPSQTLMDEAVRVMKVAPNWVPGYQGGKPVRVQYTIPLNFTLAEEKPSNPPNAPVTIMGYGGTGKFFAAVEPGFPGGMAEFYKFISANVKYPAEMKQKDIEGKVYISFVVERNGTLSDIRAIRGPGYGAEEEAVRVMNMSPKWIPGMQGNEPVRVQYTIPIAFTLSKPSAGAVTDGGGTFTLKGISPATSPLYILDGKVLNTEPGVSPFNNIVKQEDIASLEILKDATATSLYGDRGKYGVILITSTNAAKVNSALTIKGSSLLAGDPLILVDGVTKTKAELEALSPNDMASVEVWKDDATTKLYGDKAKGGVIKITTKNAAKK